MQTFETRCLIRHAAITNQTQTFKIKHFIKISNRYIADAQTVLERLQYMPNPIRYRPRHCSSQFQKHQKGSRDDDIMATPTQLLLLGVPLRLGEP
ncbi:hypothetical protein HYC85_028704 [Camellia sinensis]|uniref:Uncharacterized protein n=1 Tax=Camellia sinensis TaxID=4442 RepID=A0A7J7FVX5_CAMSI|nr:hypothetical protein HYC85_028704 [Camellia sinensis]